MQVEDDDDKVCMMEGCTQVDLLLGVCRACKRKLCHKHLGYEDHNCSVHRDASVLTCPICNRTVPCNPEDNPNVAVSQHIDRGCRDVPQSTGPSSSPGSGGSGAPARLNFCSFPSCSKNELTLILCDRCRNSYCVDHRMPSRHNCPVDTAPAAPARVSPQGSARRSPGKGSLLTPRNTRESALGSYKGDDPLTVCVFFSEDARVTPFYFKTGTKTVAGRVLDQACQLADVPNANNSSVDDRWRMFVVPHNRSEPSASSPVSLNETLSAIAQDGDVLFFCKTDELPHSVRSALMSGKMHHGKDRSSSCATM